MADEGIQKIIQDLVERNYANQVVALAMTYLDVNNQVICSISVPAIPGPVCLLGCVDILHNSVLKAATLNQTNSAPPIPE